MATPPVMLVSNRGPIAFSLDDDGQPQPRRGAGGLVSGLAPLLDGTDTTWLAAALSDGDRAAARSSDGGVVSAHGLSVSLVELDPDDQRAANEVVCNATLWFIHHHLFDLVRRPRFDTHWWAAWAGYRRVNEAFASAVAERAPHGATVLVQDYHLCLLGAMLRVSRPDLRTVHFSHTPFAGPDNLAVLPTAARLELLAGMAGHDACGFHTKRWRTGFVEACEADGVAVPRTFVAPLGPDPDDLNATAASDACRDEQRRLEETIGDLDLIVRVDRVELSKNLLRGFEAFDHLLESRPHWRERVVFGAFCYPSREGLADYRAYRNEVESLIARINDRWATSSWTPILYDPSDNYPRSVAALARADVLLVNPIRDGLNLVAKEAPIVNGRDARLVLSPGAGAWDELGEVAFEAHPFDIVGTAQALDEALAFPRDQRAARGAELRRLALRRTPAAWLADQLAAVE